MSKNRELKKKNALQPARWYRKIPWLTLIGASLIFSSWVIQNRFKVRWANEKSRLERSQLAVDIEQTRMDEWTDSLWQELHKEKPSQEVLGLSALKVIETSSNLSAWIKGRVMEDPVAYNRIIQNKRKLQAEARAMFEKGDFSNLVKASNDLQLLTKDLDDRSMEQFGERVNEVVRSEQKWDNLFLAAYVLGSALLGTQFVWTKLKENRT